MFLSTSGNSADTSLPKVIEWMVFWMASFLAHVQHRFRHVPDKEAHRS
jgi:hypothetical protein